MQHGNCGISWHVASWERSAFIASQRLSLHIHPYHAQVYNGILLLSQLAIQILMVVSNVSTETSYLKLRHYRPHLSPNLKSQSEDVLKEISPLPASV